MIAPRQLTIVGSVTGGGTTLGPKEMRSSFDYATRVFEKTGATPNLRFLKAGAKVR